MEKLLFKLEPSEWWILCYLRVLEAEQEPGTVTIESKEIRNKFSRTYTRKIIHKLLKKKAITKATFPTSKKGNIEIILPPYNNPLLQERVESETRSCRSGFNISGGSNGEEPAPVGAGSQHLSKPQPDRVIGESGEPAGQVGKTCNSFSLSSRYALKELLRITRQEELKRVLIEIPEMEKVKLRGELGNLVKYPALPRISWEAGIYAGIRCLQMKRVGNQRGFIYRTAHQEEANIQEMKNAHQTKATYSARISGRGEGNYQKNGAGL